MANKVRGITIEFNADSSNVVKALQEINQSSFDVQRQLNDVNRLLKLDPTNVELLTQQEMLLDQQLANTTQKLEALKQAEESLRASGIPENSEQMMALRREIESSNISMKKLTEQSKKTKDNLKNITKNNKNNNKLLKDDSKELNGMSQILGKLGLGNLSGALTSAGLIAGLIGAIKGLVELGYAVSETADEIDTLSQITGISRRELQELTYMSELVDVSTNDIVGSLRRLIKAMYEASEGSGTYLDAFEDLNIEILDADGNLKDSVDVFWEVINALGQMENKTERDALAMTLLGKSAMDLNPLISKTKEEIAALRREADFSGFVISDDDLTKLTDLNDGFVRLKNNLTSLKQNLVGKLVAPWLNPIIETINGWFKGFGMVSNNSALNNTLRDAALNKPKEEQTWLEKEWNNFLANPLGLGTIFGTANSQPVQVVISTDDSTLAKDLRVKIVGQETNDGRSLYR